MPAGVGQRLLHHPVHRFLDLGQQPGRDQTVGVTEADVGVDVDVDVEPGEVRRPARQCPQRGRNAELVEGGRPELGDEVAQVDIWLVSIVLAWPRDRSTAS